MTSISAASSSSYQSPLQKLQQELQADVTSGRIGSGDQNALSSALTDIDSSMQADRSSQSGSAPSSDTLKSKVDDLISAQVSSGKLTADQATELQGVFQSAFTSGGPGGASGHHGAGHAGGHHHADTGGASPSVGSDSASSTSGSTSPSDILQNFLDTLKQSQATSTSYSAGGTSAAASNNASALLFDFQS